MIYSPNIPYTDTSTEGMVSILQINILEHWENNHFNCHKNTPNLKEKSSEPYTYSIFECHQANPSRHMLLLLLVLTLIVNLNVEFIKIFFLPKT